MSEITALAAETRERRPIGPSGVHNCHLASDSHKDNSAINDRQAPFTTPRDAALALLTADPRTVRLTRKAGSLCGQLAVDPTPMSDAQADWLAILLNRAGLPPLAREAVR